MITINYIQFRRLMLPMPHEYNAEQFKQALEDQYGITEMKPLSIWIHTSWHTSWNVYFVSDYAEVFFRITYADIIC